MAVDAVPSERVPDSRDANPMASQARAASELMKALAHEGRLMILCHLVEGEKPVGELEDLIGARQAAVSQQLARLGSRASSPAAATARRSTTRSATPACSG